MARASMVVAFLTVATASAQAPPPPQTPAGAGSPFAGRWEFTVQPLTPQSATLSDTSPDGFPFMIVELSGTATTLAGTLVAAAEGGGTLGTVSVAGDELTLSFNGKWPAGQTVTFKGRRIGERIEGTVTPQSQNQPGTFIGRATTSDRLTQTGAPEKTASFAAPPPMRPTPNRVGGSFRPPRKILDVKPVYPAAARKGRVQGDVVMEAVISETGTVDQVRILQSIPELDQAAVDAVRQWRFTPALRDGVAVPTRMTVTVNIRPR